MYDTGNSITAQSQKEQSDYRAWEIEGDCEGNVISREVRRGEERVKGDLVLSPGTGNINHL